MERQQRQQRQQRQGKYKYCDGLKNSRLLILMKVIVATWVLSGNPLAEGGQPAVRSEISATVILLGMGMLLFYTRESVLQKDCYIGAFSIFFAISTVIGKSYHELGNWDYVFGGIRQLFLALLAGFGYYTVCKSCLTAVCEFIKRRPSILRREPGGRIETLVFEKHAFLLPMLLFSLMMIPYMTAFFPGTIHADATTQLFQHFGLMELTGHHPIMSTKLMGICIEIGKRLFQSDNAGIALYTIPQTMCQVLVFSYALWLLYRIKAPVIIRWAAIVFYGVFPLFPMYAVTMAKDTGYYDCMLLLVLSLMQLLWEKKSPWWNKVLLWTGAVGICLFRKEGKYIVMVVLLATAFMYRTEWRTCLVGTICCLGVTLLVEGIYMPAKEIEKGGVEEMLSIPLQQTARCIKEHGSEFPADEKERLQVFFTEDLSVIAENYDPEISDPVKGRVRLNRKDDSLKNYLCVWLEELCKYPETYLEAYLNHTYGYFYPDRGCLDAHVKCFFGMVGNQQWDTPFMSVCFQMKDTRLRAAIEDYVDAIAELPVVKLFFSPGAYVYGLLGCIICLLRKRRKRELCILLPGILVVAVCLISPANAYLRYTFPLIALTPVNFAWCYRAGN